MENILERLRKKKQQYKELEKELASPELLSDRGKYREKAKEYSDLKETIHAYDSYLCLEKEKISLEKIIEEEGEASEYTVMARKDLEQVARTLEAKGKELEELLLSEDSSDYKRNVIMEIRAGTGGVEAGIFAADLFKMYSKYAAEMGWKISAMSRNESEKGGLKEIVYSVEGHNVFKYLRFEMGTHRVQRVPETEASGRIHTSRKYSRTR